MIQGKAAARPAAEAFGMERVHLAADDSGAPALGVDLAGANAGRPMESTHSIVDPPMAVLVRDEVLTAPPIVAPPGGAGLPLAVPASSPREPSGSRKTEVQRLLEHLQPGPRPAVAPDGLPDHPPEERLARPPKAASDRGRGGGEISMQPGAPALGTAPKGTGNTIGPGRARSRSRGPDSVLVADGWLPSS